MQLQHAQAALLKALETGGDFAEIYFEDAVSTQLSMLDKKLDTALLSREHGAGIRILKGVRQVYAYTCDTTAEGLLKAASQAAQVLLDNRLMTDIRLTVSATAPLLPIVRLPAEVSSAEKVAVLKEAYFGAQDYSPEITQVSAHYIDLDKTVMVANSEGLFRTDRRVRTRLSVSAVAGDGSENQTGSEAPGRSMGFEVFQNLIHPKQVGIDSAKTAVTMLHAPKCPAMTVPVLIDSGFGGVLFHEACGHGLEATSVAKGTSIFCNKLGQAIASPLLTAIDDPTLPGEWGSYAMDDEGMTVQKNVLIERGILKSYLIDRLGSRRMGLPPTASGRRQSYRYAPTSRMGNTFIAPGESTLEELLKGIPYGLYAKKMGGGSVNPVTGEFNFAVQEGYIIKNGQIDRPVRGASLIGKGAEVLFSIDGIGKELKLAQGMCGSESGSVPVSVGQPPVRIKSMRVGGHQEENV